MPAYPSADGAAKDQKYQSYACGQHPVSGMEKTKSQTETYTGVKSIINNNKRQKITMINDFLSCISDWNLTEHWLEMTMATIRSS